MEPFEKVSLIIRDPSLSEYVTKLKEIHWYDLPIENEVDPFVYAQEMFLKLNNDIYGATQGKYCDPEIVDAFLEFKAKLEHSIASNHYLPLYRLEHLTLASVEFVSMDGDVVAVFD